MLFNAMFFNITVTAFSGVQGGRRGQRPAWVAKKKAERRAKRQEKKHGSGDISNPQESSGAALLQKWRQRHGK
jgi:hypothetical protein